MISFVARRRQCGMTYMGMLVLLVFIAFLAIVIIKVLPLYMEHMKVKSSLESLEQDDRINSIGVSPLQIEDSLLKRLTINDVEHVTKDDISITKEGTKTVVTVNYEARVSLFYNIDLVAKFTDDRVELGGR